MVRAIFASKILMAMVRTRNTDIVPEPLLVRIICINDAYTAGLNLFLPILKISLTRYETSLRISSPQEIRKSVESRNIIGSIPSPARTDILITSCCLRYP